MWKAFLASRCTLYAVCTRRLQTRQRHAFTFACWKLLTNFGRFCVRLSELQFQSSFIICDCSCAPSQSIYRETILSHPSILHKTFASVNNKVKNNTMSRSRLVPSRYLVQIIDLQTFVKWAKQDCCKERSPNNFCLWQSLCSTLIK